MLLPVKKWIVSVRPLSHSRSVMSHSERWGTSLRCESIERPDNPDGIWGKFYNKRPGWTRHVFQWCLNTKCKGTSLHIIMPNRVKQYSSLHALLARVLNVTSDNHKSFPYTAQNLLNWKFPWQDVVFSILLFKRIFKSYFVFHETYPHVCR